MSHNGHLDARTLHARLTHPVIDADGHWLEYGPVMREEFRRIGGEAAVEGLALASQRVPNSLKMTVAERPGAGSGRRRSGPRRARTCSTARRPCCRASCTSAWTTSASTSPWSIRPPGSSYHRMQDTRLRRAICRAYNVFAADQFRGLEDRVIPAAIIPMYTPEEAIEEIEFAAKELGYKVIMVGGLMRRPVPALAEEQPDAAKPRRVVRRHRHRQPPRLRPGVAEVPRAPAWPRASTTGPAPSCSATRRRTSATTTSVTSPPPAMRWPRRIFFGGVTRRFPDLNFAFLEGGVGWACMLYADLIGHWEKRNRQAIESTHPEQARPRGSCWSYAQKYGRAAVVEACAAATGWRATRTPR